MRVKLLVHLTGTRNGEEWPGYGQEVDLPEVEAQDMISSGMATPVTSHRSAEKAIPDSTATETRQAVTPKRRLKGRAK